MSLAQTVVHEFKADEAIENVAVSLYKIPLAEVLADAKHGAHTHFELVTVRIRCRDGLEGLGYTYTGGKGGSAIVQLLRDELVPFIAGKDSGSIDKLWDDMQYHLHYIGRGGLVSFAISAIDIALWDIRCKRSNMGLSQLLGRHQQSVECYAGGIDLSFDMDRLLSNVNGYLKAGFEQVKIKVGRPRYQDDIDRVAAVRDLLGPNREFMIDANYSLSPADAVRLGRACEQFNIRWFEEPTLPDDYHSYRYISERINIPLAMGENLHTIFEFQHAINWAKLGFLQPDASNIGGITGWLKVAQQAYANNIPICTHGMHELHVSLMASQPHTGSMEVHSFPIDQYTKSPLVLRDGRALVPDSVGTGVEFDTTLIRPHQII